MRRAAAGLAVAACAAVVLTGDRTAAQAPAPDEPWLSWTARQAQATGQSMYQRGRVGGFFDTRGLATNRAYNYELAATWLTPDVIRATARLAQIQSRLSDEATRQLVAEAEAAGDAVILVEIDPREGSGVIPLSWEAFLQPRDATDDLAAAGRNVPELRAVRALAGTRRRDYDYDIFWMVFPLTLADGTALFPAGVEEAELVVRIHEKEGRVRWRVPDSARR